MTIEECYAAMGGDYEEMCRRLPSPELVSRFVGMYL